MSIDATKTNDAVASSIRLSGGLGLGFAAGELIFAGASRRDAKALTGYADAAVRAPVPAGHWNAEAIAWRNNPSVRQPLRAAIDAGSLPAGIEELRIGARQASKLQATHLRGAGVVAAVGAALLLGAALIPKS